MGMYKNQNQQQSQPQPNKMDMEISEDEIQWNPTPQGFQEFLTRDYQLAVDNVQGVLATRAEMSFREMRDALLHSSDTTEQVLSDLIRNGNVKEHKGRFALIKHT